MPSLPKKKKKKKKKKRTLGPRYKVYTAIAIIAIKRTPVRQLSDINQSDPCILYGPRIVMPCNFDST